MIGGVIMIQKVFHHCRVWSNSNIGSSSVGCTLVFILPNIKMSVCLVDVNSFTATTLKFINYV